MICEYQHKSIPSVRIIFQVRADRYEKMVALRRRAEKLGYTASDFQEVNRPSSKVGRGA